MTERTSDAGGRTPPRTPFWDVLNDRQSRPQQLPAPDEPWATPQEILDALKQSRRALEANKKAPVSVAIDGRSQLTDLAHYLPADDEPSLPEYCRRLESAGSSGQFMVTLFGVQKFNAEIWNRVRRAISGMDEAGFISQETVLDLDVFLGTYDRTPGGIHRDGASNFSFVVSGEKTMLFWPYDQFSAATAPEASTQEPLGTAAYEMYEADMQKITSCEGDLIYWPRSEWHMSIDNSRSCTLNLAFYATEPSLEEQAIALALRAAGEPARATPAQVDEQWTTGEFFPPSDWSAIAKAVVQRVSEASVIDGLERYTLKRRTSVAFRVTPSPRRHRDLHDEDRLRRDPAARILWLHKGDGSLMISSGGRLLHVRGSGGLSALLAGVNTTQPQSVGIILDRAERVDSALNRQTGRSLLELLYEWHGVIVESDE
jgi:hypothetical protein